MAETQSPTGPPDFPRIENRLRDARLFFQQALRTFRATGSIVPSGSALAHALSKHIREREDPDAPLRILEAGAGTGAITRSIAEWMREGDTADLVEANPEFAAYLEGRLTGDPLLARIAGQATVHTALVTDLGTDRSYDVIVSGLPFANFTADEVREIFDYYFTVLRPGGVLSFYGYLYTKEVKAVIAPRQDYLRQAQAGWVVDEWVARYGFDTERVLPNIPPAWVHHLRRPADG